jgi:flagellar hook-associated protein 2
MTTPTAQYTGLASGINTQQLVQQIISIEGAPGRLMQQQVAALTSQQAAWNSYSGLVASVGTAARALTNGTGFNIAATSVLGTASTGAPILTATAAAGTAAGTTTVEVDAVATTGSGSTTAQASGTAAILAGGATSATFSINGTAITIDGTNNSLTGLRDAINGAGAKVTAYLLQTGTGTSLVLKAAASGANGLNLTETSGTGTLAALGYTQQAGTDASLKVDGVAITRSNNTINDAAPGITLSLVSAEVGTTVQVQVAPDTTSAATSIQAFVQAYNSLTDYITSQIPQAGATKQPPLAGQTALYQNRSSLVTAMQTPLGSNPTAMQNLSQLGISLGSDGHLSFTPAAFTSAYTSDPTSVRALFTSVMTPISTISDRISLASTGSVAQKVTSITNSVTRLNNSIDALSERLANRQKALTAQFAAMEATVSLLQSQGAQLDSALGLNSSKSGSGYNSINK